MRTEEAEAPAAPRRRREEKRAGGALQFLRELPILIIVALGIALLIKTFVVQAFYIPSGSMENTLMIGDRVLVSKFLYRFTEPQYGQIVVFVSPYGERAPTVDRGPVGNFFNSIAEGLGLKSTEKDFIKRVIATEGQMIEIKDGAVHVDKRKLPEPYLHDRSPMPDYGPTRVPKDRVFVMGDNRNNSQDSRVFGPIAESSILGRAFILIWPLDRVEILNADSN